MQIQFADLETPEGHYAVCCGAILPQEGIAPKPCTCCSALLCGRADCHNRCICEDEMNEMNQTIEEMWHHLDGPSA
jgi:hypothetical protein